MVLYNGPDWQVLGDGETVQITTPTGETNTVPLSVATALWVAGGPQVAPRSAGAGVVLLSFGNPTGLAGRLNVAIAATQDGTPPPWPAWHPEQPPAWQPCPVGRWVGLPHLGPGDGILRRCTTQWEASENAIDRGIEDRCGQIREHSADDTFVESLDYYTTQRVKLAYLRMNAQGLRDRLAEVRKKAAAVRAVLASAPAEWAAQWTPPTDVLAPQDSDPTAPCDPNALCVPQPGDYELCRPGGGDDPPPHGAAEL